MQRPRDSHVFLAAMFERPWAFPNRKVYRPSMGVRPIHRKTFVGTRMEGIDEVDLNIHWKTYETLEDSEKI